jgi:hypothetical protein
MTKTVMGVREFQEAMRAWLAADQVESAEWEGDELPLVMRVVSNGETIEVACPAPMPKGYVRKLVQHKFADGIRVQFHLSETPEVEREFYYTGMSMMEVMMMWGQGLEPKRLRLETLARLAAH